MNKRELLEACAKATGRPIDFPISEDSPASQWNPLESDGDCARMEAEKRVRIAWTDDEYGEENHVTCSTNAETCIEYYADHDNDPQKARRWASCRAVAATVEKA